MTECSCFPCCVIDICIKRRREFFPFRVVIVESEALEWLFFFGERKQIDTKFVSFVKKVEVYPLT